MLLLSSMMILKTMRSKLYKRIYLKKSLNNNDRKFSYKIKNIKLNKNKIIIQKRIPKFSRKYFEKFNKIKLLTK